MNLTAEERETHINLCDADDYATVYTCQTKVINQLKKLGLTPIKTDTHEDEIVSETYEVPKSWVVIRRPKQMNLTDEQRQERAERLRKARELKQLE